MDDYISREAVERFIENGLNNPDKSKAFGHDAVEILTEVHFMDAADVRPVVKARWEWKNTDALASFAWTCSACGQRKVFKTNFCPNCGADMTGGADDDSR